MSYFKPQVSFSLNFAPIFSVMVTLLYFFSWNFIWSGQKEPVKAQNFRLSTAHVEFHQICTLMGSFHWKYVKFQLKKYRGVMSHDIEEWCKIWRKADYLLFQKWQEFGEFWSEHSKFSKFPLWLVPWLESSFMTLKSDAKFEERLTCGLVNDMKNMAHFHQSTWKISKLGYWWDPFI